MKLPRVSSAMRVFFFISGAVIWTGIWLTGFAAANFLLYIPAIFFWFAAATGVCPGLIVTRLVFPDRP